MSQTNALQRFAVLGSPKAQTLMSSALRKHQLAIITRWSVDRTLASSRLVGRYVSGVRQGGLSGYGIPYKFCVDGIGNGYAAARLHGASEADREEPVMPKQRADKQLSPADRQREVAAILARGVIRYRNLTRTAGIAATLESKNQTESLKFRVGGLEIPCETRLSVSDDTRGLGLRGDGDEA